MLRELCEVDGASIGVKFSKKTEIGAPFLLGDLIGENGFDWSIEHNGWGSAEHLTVTVNIGSINVEDLELPLLRGIAKAKSAQ